MCAETKEHQLKVVLCWHMHQPDYRGPAHSEYQLPWVYLHSTKDYTDMIAHLESEPEARAVVNFAPVLLEQIDDYSRQVADWLQYGKLINDPLLAALAGPGLPIEQHERWALVEACRRLNHKLIKRFPAFHELMDGLNWFDRRPESHIYLNDQAIVDLLVWYHLAWMGESVRENDIRIKSLEKKARGFDVDDRRRLVTLIGEIHSGLIGRYRRMAEEGRIEISVSPYAHPIVPLLIDMDSAREAMPELNPLAFSPYPGGEARARWHIRKGNEVFERYFGFTPAGCWPSEGAVSEDAFKLFEEEGYSWIASGQQVLNNSLHASDMADPLPESWAHSPYRLHEGRLNCFFRDDGLSDRIGFTYSDWHADDAVGDFVNNLVNIADATVDNRDAVVSIIMDGENAWECYPNNANYFLSGLYKQLAEHPRIRLTTFSDCLERQQKCAPALNSLIAGSWVYGTFSTWIGDQDKNRAWEMLSDAKGIYDRKLEQSAFSEEQLSALEIQLATCEGSDWFWWFGDYNPGQTVSDFERLFRHQLSHLYALLEVDPPEYLAHVFAIGSGDPDLGGVMKRN
jgi:alpha-amylase/alpha-mannosidase (GH57 family)